MATSINTTGDKKKSTVAAYNYTVQATFISDDEEIEFVKETIVDVILNYEYMVKTMPTIYLGLRMNTKLYEKLLEHSDDAIIHLKINKFNKNSNTILEKPYINDNFIYKIPKDPNYNRALEEASNNGEDSTGKDYMKGYLGLIKIESLNDNKRLINTIVRNTNLSSLIYTYTKHMNMVMEPIDNNVVISQLVIPPIESITKLLSYIDLNYAIYPSGYRYFRDFDKTYLLSNAGNPVSDGSNTIDTIIIKIMNNIEADGKLNSTQIDQTNGTYIINIDSDNTTIEINDDKEKSFNKIIGVTTNGNVSEYDLNIPKNKLSSEKVKIKRVNNENTRSIESYKRKIEGASVLLNIVKTEIDATMIVPNKQFIVRNCEEYRKYDGKYILAYKKEVLLLQEGIYISGTTFGLAKVPD